MSKPSDSSGGRLRRTGKLLLDWLLNPPSGATAERPPAIDPVPMNIAPPRPAPVLERVDLRPPFAVLPGEASTPSDPPVIYQALHDRILDVGGLLRSVKTEMEGLAESYRAAVPPSRLLLYPWGFPKGTPPRALYWVRLARRQKEVCDDTLQVRLLKRPRWCRRLKIRTRTDLRNAVHWNGLDAHIAAVLQHHDLASCLNRAHRTLSQGSARLVRSFKRNYGGVGNLPGCPDLPIKESADDLLSDAGSRLRSCAWRMQWAMETELVRLNRLSGTSGGPAFRLEARDAGGNGVCEGFVWVNGSTRTATLTSPGRARTRWCRGELPRDEGTELLKLLDARLEVVHLVLLGLREIHGAATREMIAFRSGATPAAPG